MSDSHEDWRDLNPIYEVKHWPVGAVDPLVFRMKANRQRKSKDDCLVAPRLLSAEQIAEFVELWESLHRGFRAPLQVYLGEFGDA